MKICMMTKSNWGKGENVKVKVQIKKLKMRYVVNPGF